MNNHKEFESNGKKQYIMFDLNPKSNDIWYWENTISSPKELCGFIESLDRNQESHKAIPSWTDWTASNDSSLKYGYVKTIINQDINGLDIDRDSKLRSLYIKNSLVMAVEMCFDRYMDGHGLNKNEYKLDHHILPIRKWIPGPGMGPHCDNYDGHSNLAFSMVTYLNDDYQGGEINFPGHNINIKPKAGSTIMFPAVEPFIHEVSPILDGYRYAMATSVLKK